MKRLILLALCSGVLLLLSVCPPRRNTRKRRDPLARFGINHISAPNDPIVDQRYRNALLLGAGWNRWPLYWDSVESASGNYTGSATIDLSPTTCATGCTATRSCSAFPAARRDGGSIRGLYEPVFSDGTDTPGSGKQPNPNNPYASFVYTAVQRYKPGGTLAGQFGWQADQGIRVWEAWNEPDLRMFWSGSVAGLRARCSK